MSSWSVAIVTAALAPLPLRGIAIGIDLDAVAFGVVEIDGLADEMIGKARQRHAMRGRMHQPAREVLARRHQEGGVIKAGGIARLDRGIGRASSASSVMPAVPSIAAAAERSITVSPITSR